MKQRREKDVEILSNPDIREEEMSAWMRELFFGEEAEKFMIPEDLLEFGFEQMRGNFAKAKNEVIRRMILKKVLHTREVVVAGTEIEEGERTIKWNPYMVGAVTFAHDFGRFTQAHLGSYSDIKINFDHAEAGADLILRNSFPRLVEMGIDKNILSEAVREHSRLSYTGDEMYAKFIRDADKLGLLDYFTYHIEEFDFPNDKVTQGALDAFLEGRLVPKTDMIHRIDVFLCWLSWQFDFNFVATKKLFESGGMKAHILEEIRKMDEDLWRKVVDYPENFTP